jgi:hypothetical protein
MGCEAKDKEKAEGGHNHSQSRFQNKRIEENTQKICA